MNDANSTNSANLPTFVLQPSRGWVPLRLSELWEYRELLYFLAWRDIKVRYKQTAIGVGWVVIQPILSVLVFSVFFGRLAKLSHEEVPYPVFALSALLPWQFFARALTEGSTSLVVNERVISKVYFPRLLAPMSVVLAGLLDLAIAFLILLGLLFYYGITPTVSIFALPVFLTLAVMTALGVSFWLSALDVKYRDVRYTLPFLTQIWFFLTPVVYSSAIVPPVWRVWYGLNPMAGVVTGFRWALLGTAQPDSAMLLVSGCGIALLLVGGLIYFRRMERTLADSL